MFPTNLNLRYNYTLLNKTYVPNIVELKLISNKKITKSYWSKRGKYEKYKNAVKKDHYFGQKLRCAYCRKSLRTDAYWEDLDHVVAQTEKEKWIFFPKNLIVTCAPCNRLKNAELTIKNPMLSTFPNKSDDFKIFNPHFDKWSDHFEIFNGIFLRGIPNTKGPETYKYCQLFRHDVIINNVNEQRIWSVFTMRRLTHRLKEVDKNSIEYNHIVKAISHLIERKKHGQ